jgi:ABC-type nitrate/sulfonate/bicarbonate transport system permease component
MLAGLVWIGIVGWGLNAGLSWLQARLFPHHAPGEAR